ncbi:hypothetical protein CCH79_00012891 [Gambusia affinis]|uniref:Uncharacterized protein n=1 Tax=Gambusia affinis TaxID=33528 RepID=A0A315VZS1_GAMAF|nr:hypothetical protein CCH79_00012891 [Gambusia affinis]
MMLPPLNEYFWFLFNSDPEGTIISPQDVTWSPLRSTSQVMWLCSGAAGCVLVALLVSYWKRRTCMIRSSSVAAEDHSHLRTVLHHFFHTGMRVCRGATPPGQILYGELLLQHSLFGFRQTKQNVKRQRGQVTFLQYIRLCSTFMPQTGQARTEGQLVTPFTSGRLMSLQVWRSCRSLLMQPSLLQRSDRGAEPFHSF